MNLHSKAGGNLTKTAGVKVFDSVRMQLRSTEAGDLGANEWLRQRCQRQLIESAGTRVAFNSKLHFSNSHKGLLNEPNQELRVILSHRGEAGKDVCTSINGLSAA